MAWWRSIGSPRFVCAPMVDASELPFRLLTREFGATLCYTPMLHSRLLVEQPGYAQEHFSTSAEDRPLIAQLCGHDPSVVLAAALVLQDRGVDAVDLNLGCPQNIAKRGRYGAFLLEESEVVLSIVRALARGLRIPVTVKMRLLASGDVDATVAFARALEEAGASLLTLHGRTRHNMKQSISSTDWDAIARVKRALTIPVIANGSIACLDDVDACFAVTGADAVMSSEALLENPALFARGGIAVRGPLSGAGAKAADVFSLARRYLALTRETNFSHMGIIKGHMFKMLFGALRAFPEHMDTLASSLTKTTEDIEAVVERTAAAVDATYAERLWEGGASGPRAVYTADARARIDAASGMRAAAVSSDVRCAWVNEPAFLIDPSAPGAWYHRHRPDAFGGAKPPAGVRAATLKRARERALVEAEGGIVAAQTSEQISGALEMALEAEGGIAAVQTSESEQTPGVLQ